MCFKQIEYIYIYITCHMGINKLWRVKFHKNTLCLVTYQETHGNISVFLSISISVNLTDNDHTEPCC